MANVQAEVEVQLFGANLVGMISKISETVGKTETGDKKRNTLEFLVMPSTLNENEPIDVKTVVDEINKTIYKIQNNTSTLPDTVPAVVTEGAIEAAMDLVGLKEASLTFMQTFVHYKNVTETGQEKPVTDLTEYAIGIHIKANPGQEAKSDFAFLQIREAYINVWDTENEKVLERMQIWTPELLETR